MTPPIKAVTKESWKYFRGPPMGPIAAQCRNEALGQTCWTVFYESSIVETALDRKSKESIAVGVSQENGCKFCTSVHEPMRNATPQVKGGPNQEALLQWATRTRYAVRGKADSLPAGPLRRPQHPEAVAMVIQFNMHNRYSDCFANPIPAPLLCLMRPVARLMTNGTGGAGSSFDIVQLRGSPLLEASPTPGDQTEEELPASLATLLARSPDLLLSVQAWSRASVREARKLLRNESRAIVRDAVRAWGGEHKLSRAKEIHQLVESTPHEADKPFLRLALSVALAPERMVDDVVMIGSDEERVIAVGYGTCEASKEIADRVSSVLLLQEEQADQKQRTGAGTATTPPSTSDSPPQPTTPLLGGDNAGGRS